MKTELACYEIYPKVFRAGALSAVHIRPLGRHAAFEEGVALNVNIYPMNECSDDYFRSFCDLHPYEQAHGLMPGAYGHPLDVYRALNVIPQAGMVTFEYCFKSEQEYIIELFKGENKKAIVSLRVYAVADDLFGLLPLKGCMHAHSYRSDGKEAPEIVAASYRRAGYDYLAVTDHGQYAPSLEAIHAYRGIKLDFQLYSGEEVHAPDSNIHIINFAGEASVNDLMRADPERYYSECETLRKAYGLPDSRSAFEYASSQWVFRKIREVNGLSILAHPNWIHGNTYNIRPAMYRQFLKDGGFDALELVNGGDTPDENEQQVAIWQQARADGMHVIPTASDDSHGTINGQWFDICRTYVLVKANTNQDIFDGIRGGRCVANLRYRNESSHFYGEARMVSYLMFLEREYFPLHDDLCIEEGRLMKEHVLGAPDAPARLEMLQGQTLALAKRALQCGI